MASRDLVPLCCIPVTLMTIASCVSSTYHAVAETCTATRHVSSAGRAFNCLRGI